MGISRRKLLTATGADVVAATVSGGTLVRAATVASFALPAPHELGSPIAVARNHDGRLELFGTTASGDLNRAAQRSVSGDLGPWARIGSGGWQSVATRTDADGRVELFAIDQAGTIRRLSQTAVGGSAYTGPDAGFDASFTYVAALRDQWGGLEVFATAQDGTIHHRWQDAPSADSWSPWVLLGGSATRLAVELGADGRAVLIGVDGDGTLFQRKKLVANGQTEQEWGPVFPLDGNLDSVAMARNLDGRLAVFGTNSDGQVFQRFETAPGNAAWTPWARLPGRMRHIAAERNGSGRIELFAVGDDGTVLHSKQSNPNATTWSPWAPVGFQLRSGNSFNL